MLKRIMAAAETKDAAGLPLLGLTNPLNSLTESTWAWNSDRRTRFANAISDWSGTPLMLRERNMLAVMDRLTDKPEWSRKLFDEDIVAKWKKEALDMFKNEPPEKQFSENMWNHVRGLIRLVKPS